MASKQQQQIIDNAGLFIDIANKYPHKEDDQKEDLQENEFFVAVRIRPTLEEEKQKGAFPAIYYNGPQHVVAHDMNFNFKGQPAVKSTDYKVDAAFGPEHTNEEVYEKTIKPLVPWVLSGGVATLFAYGQTGSGKTYTVTAMEKMVAAELFSKFDHSSCELYMSFFELFGNNAFDLLNERSGVSIMEDGFGVVQLVNAKEYKINDADEFLSLIEKGAKMRRTEETEKNHTSSRSHALCRIRVNNTKVKEMEDGVLFMVDLAGSEGSADTKHHNKERIQESKEINKSLSTLKDCIRNRALSSSNKHVHIPYRTTRLTHLLKDTFDLKSSRSSHCKTVVIANVAPSVFDTQQSLNTLRFIIPTGISLLWLYIVPLKVVVPKTKLEYHALNPSSWNNKELKEWIANNSGNPAISSDNLAPFESGKQLCRLPHAEFIARCMKQGDIPAVKAQSFYEKLWRLHTDWRTKGAESDDKKEEKTAPVTDFRTRIRPGMFVSLRNSTPTIKFVMVLAPFMPHYMLSSEYLVAQQSEKEVRKQVDTTALVEEIEKKEKKETYLCCVLAPSVMNGTYELHVKYEMVVDVNDMEEEIQVEYDSATRFYYILV